MTLRSVTTTASHRQCRKLISEYGIKREEAVIQANDVGKFYSFVNGKMACSSGIGFLKVND